MWEELRLNPRGVRTDPLRVSSAIRPLGGAWSAPQLLSEDQRRFTSGVSAPGRNPMVPGVSVLPSGAALAVWERASGLSTTCCQRVEVAVRPAGGAFGPALTLTEAVDRGLAVVTDAKGAGERWGVLAWNETALQLFERTEAGASVGPLAIPGTLDQFSDAALALAPDGAASVLKGVPLSSGRLAARCPAPARWPRPRGRREACSARIMGWVPATSPRRSRRRAWARDLQLGSAPPLGPRRAGADRLRHRRPEAVRRGWRARRGSGAPLRASTAAPDGLLPTLAVDPSGTAVLAWIGGNQRVRVARSAAAGSVATASRHR